MSMDSFLVSLLVTLNRINLLNELEKSVNFFNVIILFPSKRSMFIVNNINTLMWQITVWSQQWRRQITSMIIIRLASLLTLNCQLPIWCYKRIGSSSSASVSLTLYSLLSDRTCVHSWIRISVNGKDFINLVMKMMLLVPTIRYHKLTKINKYNTTMDPRY